MSHTPTPWFSGGCVVYGNDDGAGNGDIVADLLNQRRSVNEIEANAEFICRAVNCHDELLEACQQLAYAATNRDNTMGDPCRLIQCKEELWIAAAKARDVIAKATNQQEKP